MATTMAAAVGSQACLLPRALTDSCSTSTSSSACVRAALPSPRFSRAGLSLRLHNNHKNNNKGSALLRASALSSASSSFQGRLCLVIACPSTREVRERRTGVQASLLGVGAPEALVIGVVALLVFGPKGLAEVARTLGKSLRAFQPTIKELQQVSREFKATLEQEIGLDELRNPSTYDSPSTSQPRPNSVSSPPTSIPSTLSATEAPPAAPKTEEAPAQPKPYTTEDYLRITEDQANALVTEEQRKASAAAAWGGSPPTKPVAETSSEGQAELSADSGSQVGSTPTEPIEKPADNGSPKL